jgi:ABC-type hemin transport system substrate-binding protein
VSLFILELPRKKARAVGHYSQAISRTQEQSAKKPDKKRVFFISIVNNRIKQGFQATLDRPELK